MSKEKCRFINAPITESQYNYFKDNCINMRQYLIRLITESLKDKIDKDK